MKLRAHRLANSNYLKALEDPKKTLLHYEAVWSQIRRQVNSLFDLISKTDCYLSYTRTYRILATDELKFKYTQLLTEC